MNARRNGRRRQGNTLTVMVGIILFATLVQTHLMILGALFGGNEPPPPPAASAYPEAVSAAEEGADDALDEARKALAEAETKVEAAAGEQDDVGLEGGGRAELQGALRAVREELASLSPEEVDREQALRAEEQRLVDALRTAEDAEFDALANFERAKEEAGKALAKADGAIRAAESSVEALEDAANDFVRSGAGAPADPDSDDPDASTGPDLTGEVRDVADDYEAEVAALRDQWVALNARFLNELDGAPERPDEVDVLTPDDSVAGDGKAVLVAAALVPGARGPVLLDFHTETYDPETAAQGPRQLAQPWMQDLWDQHEGTEGLQVIWVRYTGVDPAEVEAALVEGQPLPSFGNLAGDVDEGSFQPTGA